MRIDFDTKILKLERNNNKGVIIRVLTSLKYSSQHHMISSNVKVELHMNRVISISESQYFHQDNGEQ